MFVPEKAKLSWQDNRCLETNTFFLVIPHSDLVSLVVCAGQGKILDGSKELSVLNMFL